MTTKQINPGDRIKTTYGRWYTVEFVHDNMIYVEGLQQPFYLYHIIEVTR